MRRATSHAVLIALSAVVAAAPMALSGCNTTPDTAAKRESLTILSKAFVDSARKDDPTLSKFFDSCVGYAAFPEIGKGGFIVGGGYGRGQVFGKNGALLGFCDVSQGSVGAIAGGQSFGELIFFETEESFRSFKGGKFALAAQASAVAVKAGAGAAAKYENGVAVFIRHPEGLMVDASVGGQQFSYQPKSDFE